MINRKSILLLLGSIICLCGFLFLSYKAIFAIGGNQLEDQFLQTWFLAKDFLIGNGFFLFLSIAILPGLILPVAPLLTLAGIWAESHGVFLACLYCLLALLLNLSWTYWIARGPARSLIQKLLAKTKFDLPKSSPENIFQWALILRLTPGVPFIFANYGLGILKMPFFPYLSISFIIIGITACGYVLTFAGIFGGNWSYMWMGVCLITIMILLGKMALRKKKDAN